MGRVDVLPWLTGPLHLLPADPLIVSLCNWQHEPGEDWSAELSTRYDGYAEITVELCVGREKINGEIGYIATVSGGVLEPSRSMSTTLPGAMLRAEEMAIRLICDRQLDLVSADGSRPRPRN